MTHTLNPIQVSHLTKRYQTGSLFKKTLALDNVSLTVKKGEIFGFLGPNGAGKTTLIKILVGIMSADSGECLISGLDSQSREAKMRMGYLPERPYFHDFLTASEFLRFHGRLLGLSESHISHQIPKMLDRVGLKKSRDQKLRTFSKGMLQRIGLAQALMHDPDLLILDEPMSGLDPVGRREVRDLITEVAQSGKTVFFSTHIVHDVEVICDAVGFIQGGKLKGSGNIEELLGATLTSMEIRFGMPEAAHPEKLKNLHGAKKTMEGWAIEIEATAEKLEQKVNAVIHEITIHKGSIKAVVPRRSNLEEIFFHESMPK